MLTKRNSELIHNARRVFIKPQEPGAVTWQQIYGTPSSIRWSSRSRTDAAGNRVETTVTLDYPGMGNEQFAALQELVNDTYALQVESDHRDLYELAGNETPAKASYSFQNFGTEISFNVTTISAPRYLMNLEANALLMPELFPLTLATL